MACHGSGGRNARCAKSALSCSSLVMDQIRREFLKLAGIVTLVAPAMLSRGARSAIVPLPGVGTVFDVRSFGAVGDGKNIDSPAINRAIAAAGAKGGTVYVPAGTYACYSLRLTSAVALYLDQGATILAADTPRDGTISGYDPAESNVPWEAFQDFGHNHWHNSLIWGENLDEVTIQGTGLIWGKGLSRGEGEGPVAELASMSKPGPRSGRSVRGVYPVLKQVRTESVAGVSQ